MLWWRYATERGSSPANDVLYMKSSAAAFAYCSGETVSPSPAHLKTNRLADTRLQERCPPNSSIPLLAFIISIPINFVPARRGIDKCEWYFARGARWIEV